MADLFPEVTMDAYTKVDGVRYGVTEKFGYNTISYNRAKVDAADMESLSALAYDKYKGRIAIYDYYLPVIGLVAMSLGKKTAELTEADLPAIKEVLLKMKANAKAVTDVVSSQTVLATGEADVNAFTVVIVLNVRGRVLGAVVDSVSDVAQLSSDMIREAPQMSAAVDTSYITGIAHMGERLLIVMDIESLMSSAEMGLIDQTIAH